MNADRTFWIGKDHNICEDYAIAEHSAGLAYAIVSDGCSASPEVDFGARALAMSAKRELRLTRSMCPGSPENFGQDIIRNAERVRDVFPYLSPQCLDATLLVAYVKEKLLTLYMYGDGVFVHRSIKGKITTAHIHLTSGAPDYLSYHLDPLRKQAYDKLEDNKKEVSVTMDGKTIQVNTKPLEPYWLTNVAVEEGDIVAVISDGINSFRRADNTAILWTELIDEFTAFKNFEGEFVIRRVSAFKRKCLKEGTTHSDDISVAAILV